MKDISEIIASNGGLSGSGYLIMSVTLIENLNLIFNLFIRKMKKYNGAYGENLKIFKLS